MPLGGLFSGGVFETWVGGNEYRPRVRVIVHDETGLVRAAMGSDESANLGRSRMAFSVPITGGCGTRVVYLAFHHAGSEYVIQQRNDDFGCGFLDLWGYGAVSIMLWGPVDGPIQLDSPYEQRLL